MEYQKKSLILAIAIAAVAFGVKAQIPSGGEIKAGIVTLKTPSTNALQIHQASHRAIIHWNNFSIDKKATVNVFQPNSSSALLNRVTSNMPSKILGQMKANGNVYLINPNGIFVGAGANINTNSLVLSTLDIDNNQFMGGGDMRFLGNSNNSATVENLGTINATGGDVFLMGHQIKNKGTISAKNGTVGLGAGNDILLRSFKNDDDQRLLVNTTPEADLKEKIGIDQEGIIEAANAEFSAEGHSYETAINVPGEVKVQGIVENDGKVLLNSNGGNIQLNGTVLAKKVNGDGGNVYLQGGTQNDAKKKSRVLVAGKVDVSGAGSSNVGGYVEITGQEVGLLETAELSANGASGGGVILVGGSYQGKEDKDVQNAQHTFVGAGAKISAEANFDGNGGKIIVWADKSSRFYGSGFARGGSNSGKGGFIEVSGKEWLDWSLAHGGDLQTTHENAGENKERMGTVLFDPTDITITSATNNGTFSSGLFSFTGNPSTATISVSDILASLNSGNNIVISTNSAGTGTGNITWDVSSAVDLNNTTESSINLIAQGGYTQKTAQNFGKNNVTISSSGSQGITILNEIQTNQGDVTLRANHGDGFIALDAGGKIKTNGGNVLLDANAVDESILHSRSSAITLDHRNVTTIDTTNGATAGNVTIEAKNISPFYNSNVALELIGGSNANAAINAKGGSINIDISNSELTQANALNQGYSPIIIAESMTLKYGKSKGSLAKLHFDPSVGNRPIEIVNLTIDQSANGSPETEVKIINLNTKASSTLTYNLDFNNLSGSSNYIYQLASAVGAMEITSLTIAPDSGKGITMAAGRAGANNGTTGAYSNTVLQDLIVKGDINTNGQNLILAANQHVIIDGNINAELGAGGGDITIVADEAFPSSSGYGDGKVDINGNISGRRVAIFGGRAILITGIEKIQATYGIAKYAGQYYQAVMGSGAYNADTNIPTSLDGVDAKGTINAKIGNSSSSSSHSFFLSSSSSSPFEDKKSSSSSSSSISSHTSSSNASSYSSSSLSLSSSSNLSSDSSRVSSNSSKVSSSSSKVSSSSSKVSSSSSKIHSSSSNSSKIYSSSSSIISSSNSWISSNSSSMISSSSSIFSSMKAIRVFAEKINMDLDATANPFISTEIPLMVSSREGKVYRMHYYNLDEYTASFSVMCGTKSLRRWTALERAFREYERTGIFRGATTPRVAWTSHLKKEDLWSSIVKEREKYWNKEYMILGKKRYHWISNPEVKAQQMPSCIQTFLPRYRTFAGLPSPLLWSLARGPQRSSHNSFYRDYGNKRYYRDKYQNIYYYDKLFNKYYYDKKSKQWYYYKKKSKKWYYYSKKSKKWYQYDKHNNRYHRSFYKPPSLKAKPRKIKTHIR